MDIDGGAVGRGKPHAAEYVRRGAERLAVHEVAPAAEDLTDEQTEHRKVKEGLKGDALSAADDIDNENARDDAAVYRKSALPHRKQLRRVCKVVRKVVEHDKVQPCADYAHRDEPDDDVIKIVLLYPEAFTPL